MEAPLHQIVENTGEEGSVVVDKVQSGKGNHGYNASAGEYGDMIELRILDPAKNCTALQAAASVAALITAPTMVSDLPDEGGAPVTQM